MSVRFWAFACVIGTGNTQCLSVPYVHYSSLNHTRMFILEFYRRRARAHAPCLAWGHVRCVYSERAVTVPEHPLSRASCFLVHTRVFIFYASWVQLGDPPGHAARRSTPTLDSTRGELRLRLRTQYNEPP
jgi:hypothetical protein